MRSGLAAIAILWAALALPVLSAHAMQFDLAQGPSGDIVMIGRGPIVPGDMDRFTAALGMVPSTGRKLAALALDSGGGNVAEAKQLLTSIRTRRIPVIIPRGSQCASACFLLFAASPRRLAATDALVGVHSASQNGSETDTSLAVTTLMARDARDLGVPPAIIGKMVETTPGRVEWLDPGDLALMNVTVYDGDLSAALRQIAQSGAPQPAPQPAPLPGGFPAPATMPAPGPLPAAAAFTAGRDARRLWEAWLAGLRGPYRDGAMFARTQMDQSEPAACYGPNNVNRGDFTLGCTVADQRLSTVIAKMRANPDYAAGWNALGPPVAFSPPIVVSEPVEQEYQGAYFCVSQVAHLTMKVFQGSDQTRRRALLVFGPHTTSPNVPRGAFEVEGTIGGNGALSLAPLRWVSQPPNYPWFGIDGRSDDGDKTYSGRVTGKDSCTRFTLERTNAAAVAR